LVFGNRVSRANEFKVKELKTQNQNLTQRVEKGEVIIENSKKEIQETKDDLVKKSKLLDELKESIPEKNRIIYLASEMSANTGNGRIVLEELQSLSRTSNNKENKELAKKYLNDICNEYTNQYDKEITKNKIKKENLEKLDLEEIQKDLEFIASEKKKYLSDIAQSLSGINSLFATKFTICDLDDYRIWVKKKKYLKIIKEHLG